MQQQVSKIDILPGNEDLRNMVLNNLKSIINKRPTAFNYVAKTFPSILVDVVRLIAEEATAAAHEQIKLSKNIKDLDSDCAKNFSEAVHKQLEPFFIYHHLLGKCPQVAAFIYNYFNMSCFQPLPANFFEQGLDSTIEYKYHGFCDELVIDILSAYFKYLAFNPQWFASCWNWAELGKLAVCHTNENIRYLASCCLSIITKPTRLQHLSLLRNAVVGNSKDPISNLIELQTRYTFIYDNSFKPCIEPRGHLALDCMHQYGTNEAGYQFCDKTLTKLANILLNKKSINSEDMPDFSVVTSKFLPIERLLETISQIAYAISVNKPCFVRGKCGSGKTTVIDYIAAQTGRINSPDIIKVQIGDQIDSRSLIGSYVCTNLPGQFKWQPGPLTKAMISGSWIVFEDINLAPSDVVQVIHSVIENMNLKCIPCCPIRLESPHPDFRIFFTQRIDHLGQTKDISRLGFSSIDKLCDTVYMPDLFNEDLKLILEQKYGFKSLADTIVTLFRSAQQSALDSSQGRPPRVISLRDLTNFCDRLRQQKLNPKADSLTNVESDFFFLSAIECFICFLNRDQMTQCAEKIGEQLQIPSNQSIRLAFQRRPQIMDSSRYIDLGRVKLAKQKSDQTSISKIAYTSQCLILMERLGVCIQNKEPVLLVGETGVGKTSIVQHLAYLLKTNLTVINLSQQSDSSDLLGGFRPASMITVMEPMKSRIESLLEKTFNEKKNNKFARHIAASFITAQETANWKKFLRLIITLYSQVIKKTFPDDLVEEWTSLANETRQLAKIINSEEAVTNMALSFVEGSLIRSVREGGWILLDEINLAEPDVLQCLLQILDNIHHSHFYMPDSPDGHTKIPIHDNFRIFACMNPSTDVGKRDLPAGTRNRFTEFFVHDVTETNDLRLIVESYIRGLPKRQIEDIIKFYQRLKSDCLIICDVSGNRPNYSLRTLCRALSICSIDVCHNSEKSLLESLKITFLQQLNEKSEKIVMKMLEETIFRSNISSLLKAPIPIPKDKKHYVQVNDFWIQTGSEKPDEDIRYIITDSVFKNIQTISRIISLGQRKLPILIQGNTSVGKTSLISYIARLTGNLCIRINNHEHTDLEEYIGRYMLGTDGKLSFREGLLIKAMRKGYWIIFDELNLAPCELLEALNRVLDDNREIFIPETKETIKAHPEFMLFATQNPPEHYSGRKLLSRAFRNRFVEINFDEIPHSELEFILHMKCELPQSYAQKMVKVMKELQLMRRESDCFNGKSGFMTLRDVFRWGQRYLIFKKTILDDQSLDWEYHIAKEGLILLEARVRTREEAEAVKRTLEKVFKRELDREKVYSEDFKLSNRLPTNFKHIKLTDEFRRLYIQLSSALHYGEPVLLCGPTGCGKTTAAQVYAFMKSIDLVIYNCHQNTESSDFIGSVRPNRSDRSEEHSNPFVWLDGPLITAMKKGHLFLMDEISLADDAVLERINSVLEPSRSITLTENYGEEIQAKGSFMFVATMNPGGDFGKKELSGALRNRLTEIYCYESANITQIMDIVTASLSKELLAGKCIKSLLTVMEQFIEEFYLITGKYSLREILSWAKFISKMTGKGQPRPLSLQEAIINGVSLVFLDQFGTCGFNSMLTTRKDSVSSLKSSLRRKLRDYVDKEFTKKPRYLHSKSNDIQISENLVQFKKFFLACGPLEALRDQISFVFDVPRVKKNLMKIVRAMQLDRPILLEGDPGVGKTSIVSALAKLTGHQLVRFNLSEQTDITDLFGSDLPDECEDLDNSVRFSWHDGPLLRALKKSDWILLDELNLASQSILEGLNACFDHRSEIHVPELSKTFKVDRSATRIFASQNPFSQGSARKGLPQSFLNRFTTILIEAHEEKDMEIILKKTYPHFPYDLIKKMVEFNQTIARLAHESRSFDRKSGNSDFNLRDLLYWCELMDCSKESRQKFQEKNLFRPERFVQYVYLDRLRTSTDKDIVSATFEQIFKVAVYEPPYRELRFGETCITLSQAVLPRFTKLPPHLAEYSILKYQMPYLESMMKAIHYNKMPILIGQAGSGKRSMIKILAGITGNNLNVVGANSEMDTLELLGSYEQKSSARGLFDFIEDIESFVIQVFNTSARKESVSTWSNLCFAIWGLLRSTKSNQDILSSEVLDTLRFKIDQLKELMNNFDSLTLLDSQMQKLCEFKTELDKLDKKLSQTESTLTSGNFEWVDSVLIKSIREGSWLLIENANLMNPATLDRLNSLLEPGGSISLTEKGAKTNDDVECIKPHKNFRLFLTIDPQYGELSRAMKNRGVEIFVELVFYYEDFLILLHQCGGYAPVQERTCMAYCIMQTCSEVHKKITGQPDGGSLLTYFALNYTAILTHQVRREDIGNDIEKILSRLLIYHYAKNGYTSEQGVDETLAHFVEECMSENKKNYTVSLNDARYLWVNFMYDLFHLSGGDAIPPMIQRDEKILLHQCDLEQLSILKSNEIVHDVETVLNCLGYKLFLEHATHDDLEYRLKLLRKNCQEKKIIDCIDHIILADKEYLLLAKDLLPSMDSSFVRPSEFYVDIRNSPDLHYVLQTIDYDKTSKLEGAQNRWLLSNYTSMLQMILELSIAYSQQGQMVDCLINQGVKFKEGVMDKRELIRPCAEIIPDLATLLQRILLEVSKRCFSNEMTAKIMPKLFWINYFLCKLQRSYTKQELIAVCNQIPTIWALTYLKVIRPLMRECKLQDIKFRDAKLSYLLNNICDFFGTNKRKFDKDEKSRHKVILNMYASTTVTLDSVNKQISKMFNELVSTYVIKVKNETDTIDLSDVSLAYCISWSNSSLLSGLYAIVDQVLVLESERLTEYDIEVGAKHIAMIEDTKKFLNSMETRLRAYNDKRFRALESVASKKNNSLNQISPIWQNFIFRHVCAGKIQFSTEKINQILKKVNGIFMSPRFYQSLCRFLNDHEEVGDSKLSTTSRERLNKFYTLLVDLFPENSALNSQIVGWAKMRDTTSDLVTSVPQIPEYSALLSYVSSYCFDEDHLKISSLAPESRQLSAFLYFCWNCYHGIKATDHARNSDTKIAEQLFDLKKEADMNDFSNNILQNCDNLETYLKNSVSGYDKVMETINKSVIDCSAQVNSSIKLICLGYLIYRENAPLFSIDPALRAREKLDIYKSELTHIKLELYLRNILFYWKSGENLQLNEISDPQEATDYPFSHQLLVNRRIRLEKRIAKLNEIYNRRPLNDDGSQYQDLRNEVDYIVNNQTKITLEILRDFIHLLETSSKVGSKILSNLAVRLRMMIKNLEKCIHSLRHRYSLYSDITTNFVAGLCLVLQGMRSLYATLDQRLTLDEANISYSYKDHLESIGSLFSLNDHKRSTLNNIHLKLFVFKQLPNLCSQHSLGDMQSKLLLSVFEQLIHHIEIVPSDVSHCLPIVDKISKLFYASWLNHEAYLTEQKQKLDELYQFRPAKTSIGGEVSFEQKQMVDLSKHFPTYEHFFRDFIDHTLTSPHDESLTIEEKVVKLVKTIDYRMCVDMCKAHMRFIFTASSLNIQEANLKDSIDYDRVSNLESQLLFSIIRQNFSTFNNQLDGSVLECFIIRAMKLIKLEFDSDQKQEFDIYHQCNPVETLKLQSFLHKLMLRISKLKIDGVKGYEFHPTLKNIVELIDRVDSFMLKDPFMKFFAGAQSLLELVDSWNRQSIPKEDKMFDELNQLVEMIKSWRTLELRSWSSTMQRVKSKYLDESLCEIWFRLFEAFEDPLQCALDYLKTNNIEIEAKQKNLIYDAFTMYVREFLETATFGDFELRLDLIQCFIIHLVLKNVGDSKYNNNDLIDLNKLINSICNAYLLFRNLYEPVKAVVAVQTNDLTQKLNQQLSIVSWQGKSLWDIRNNFRNSHKSLNKIIGKYSELLKTRIQISDTTIKRSDEKPQLIKNSEDIKYSMVVMQLYIKETDIEISQVGHLNVNKNLSQTLQNFKSLNHEIAGLMTTKYQKNINNLEQTISTNYDHMKNFFSHKVDSVIINPKDSKETKEEKLKSCREMYHSKKFALNCIFKELKELGLSYLRGNNSAFLIDSEINAHEPIKGLGRIPINSSFTTEAKLLDKCTSQYYDLLKLNMLLYSKSDSSVVDGDVRTRAQGFTFDFILSITKHQRHSVSIYKRIVYLQTLSSRLNRLMSTNQTKSLRIVDFKKFNQILADFNDLIERSELMMKKLDYLLECQNVLDKDLNPLAENSQSTSPFDEEFTVLKDVISKSSETVMMSNEHVELVKQRVDSVKDTLKNINSSLKNLSDCKIESHIFCDTDVDILEQSRDQFLEALRKLLPQSSIANEDSSGLFAQLAYVCNEAEEKLDMSDLKEGAKQLQNLNKHPNLQKLDIRLQKFVRELMLGVQDFYQEEKNIVEKVETKKNDFQFIDSAKIDKILRLDSISKCLAKCLLTLNSSGYDVDVYPVIEALKPSLHIYVQCAAIYLNIILTSLHVKLTLGVQAVYFFLDLMTNGFGLPIKMLEDNSAGENLQGIADSDNTGFGPGDGNKDVSDRLEFESQLDDLKKMDSEEQKEDETEDVKAHDDGVEMSEDFGGEAKGPEQNKEADDAKENEKDDENEAPDKKEEELDKEMGSVEDDEGRLDENLWGEQSDLEADDEEDLKQASGDVGQSDSKESGLQAQNDNLDEKKQDGDLNNDVPESPLSDTQSAEGEDGDFSPDDEAAAAAAVNAQTAPDVDEKAEDQDISDAVDMDLSEDETSDQKAENETKNDDGNVDINMGEVEEGKTEETEADSTESKDENVKGDEEKQDEDLNKTGSQSLTNQSSVVNDDFVDHTLEKIFDPDEVSDTQSVSIEELVKNSSAQGGENNQDQEQQSAGIKSRKVGKFTIFDALPEEEDEPIDYDDNEDDPKVADEDQPMSDALDSRVRGAQDDTREEQQKKSDQKAASTSEEAKNDEKAPKRTLAGPSEDNKPNKRARTLDAASEDKTKKEEDTTEEAETDKKEVDLTTNTFRHVATDTNNTVEVIDLVSDEDGTHNDSAQDSAVNPKLRSLENMTSSDDKKNSEEKMEQQQQEADGERKTVEAGSEAEDGEIMNEISDLDNCAEFVEQISDTDDDFMDSQDTADSINTSGDSNKQNRQQKTSFSTNYGLLKKISDPSRLTDDEKSARAELVEKIDVERSSTKADLNKLAAIWLEFTKDIDHLTTELCQQLQIVLQPTKMSKYKGDYKSGKRLNMRKIIGYIASHYKKDKIWLRRTKPNKRNYQIALAVDNSSSMSENNCRQMTYQSLALLAKSLTLIESGSLSVVSFGEKVQVIHDFDEPYVAATSGAQWLRDLRFNERKTSYAKLLEHSYRSFENRLRSVGGAQQLQVNQLLVIISDGRSFSSEMDEISEALIKLRAIGVMSLFVIIDNLKKNEASIMDITRWVDNSEGGGKIESYMESFPFPFYVVLRQLDSMPSILSEALRQWFELCSSK